MPELKESDSTPRGIRLLGPGLITGASDDDPSGIGTYSQVGAQFGFGMLWTMLFAYPLMSAIQEIAARIGRATGHGIAGNLRRHYPTWFSVPIVTALLIANILNIGADIGAMGASLKLLIGGPALLYDVLFALTCVLGMMYCSYKRYSGILKWLTAVILAYVATAFIVKVPWTEALKATVIPGFSTSSSYLAALVGVLGTTISPYLFFWQASEEAEEVHDSKIEKALTRAPEQAKSQFHRIRIDTYVGMFASNLVAWFIILAAAVTLHAHGVVDIDSAQTAAKALKPLGGNLAFLLFAGGIIGTGMLAVPVLAGSAAYAVGEEMHRRVGIDYSPRRAPFFYIVLAVATAIGVGLNFTPINPIKALVWSAMINGVVASPVMVAMMLMIRNKKVMGDLAGEGKYLYVFGWLATTVMVAAVVAMFATIGR
ncbi:Nramp family divalent metal transporter [Fimbriimonas ginsengisoli]|uniref:Manganese transport protein MntH n=1 Tax=Fimbriimonas ginsengisoli Gsoil 348 TaxID=661478 RepID=A0A068NQJ8_FIMGI|nr:Nramp family divalent metal transporter [Fimbriimonas ginsengisoli]AIE85838.1 Manganese transport protein MntH [Fimbriimonas ginsengisoli Gsoil 348]